MCAALTSFDELGPHNLSSKMSSKDNIGFVGAGNMAKAIVEGLLDSEWTTSDHVWVSAPSNRNLPAWQARGCHTTNDNSEVVRHCSLIFLCVKPQYLKSVTRLLEPDWTSEHLVISVLAGATLKTLRARIPDARIVKCTPNTPMLVKTGVCPLSRGPTVTDKDIEMLKAMLKPVGLCEEIPEHLHSVVTGVAGSSPAYIYMTIQSLADGGVKMGLPRAMSLKMAAQAVMGAAKMVLETGMHPEELKDNVCSPGGTTIAAVHALEKGQLRATLINAVEVATLRCQELGAMQEKPVLFNE